jgi:N-acetylglucosaminyl-diphospho-decaprenol L-rhamnosyltransferase
LKASGGILHSAAEPMKQGRVPSSVDVSICILNWNGSRLLADCLESLRRIRHSNGIRYEAVVVDNGSSDDSLEMVRRDFPEVHLVTIPENIGISAATNEGLRLGTGRYSLILNNDMVLQDDCLDQMVKFLDRNPKAGIAGGRLLNPDGSTQVNYYPGRLPSVGSILADLFWLNRLRGPRASSRMSGWDPNQACRLEQVPGAFMMVRAEVFEQIGFWDSDFTCWYEDVDFCCRCLQAGWEIWYLPGARIIHYGGSTFQGLEMSQKALWRFHGLLRYSAKHFSWMRNTLVRLLVLLTLLLRLPIVTVLSLWPRTEKRRAWKGIVPAYLKLIAKLSN